MPAQKKLTVCCDEQGALVILIIIPILMVLISAGVFGWVWWARSQGDKSEFSVPSITKSVNQVSLSSVPASSAAELCAQVVTPAVDPVSGQCRIFATPCEVPKNFKEAVSCDPESENWQRYVPSSGVFSMDYPETWDYTVRQTSIDVLGFSNLITQVAFDDRVTGRRNPFRELLGRIELSWLSSASYVDKSTNDFIDSYYRTATPLRTPMKVGGLEADRVEHTHCPDNAGCIDYVFKLDKTFYVLRSLSPGDKSEDEKIILTMLNSWRFLK